MVDLLDSGTACDIDDSCSVLCLVAMGFPEGSQILEVPEALFEARTTRRRGKKLTESV